MQMSLLLFEIFSLLTHTEMADRLEIPTFGVLGESVDGTALGNLPVFVQVMKSGGQAGVSAWHFS